ncbi:MAG: hypothetical protein QW304_08740 [Thermoproteota archaeon]
MKKNITLGCDPEFEELKTSDWYTPMYTSLRENTSSPIGTDGAGSQVELRPKASADPGEVIDSLAQLIERVDVPLSTIGDRFPLGGHIHVGLPGVENEDDVDEKVVRSIVKLLDNFIGKKTLPLSGEARGEYKELGAYEIKPWGFEYRTPPAAVFYRPEMAEITLKLTKNLVEKFLLGEIGERSYVVFEDYITDGGLTPLEVDHWHTMICQYKKNPPICINELWGAKVSLINFRDEWDERVKKFIRNALEGIPYRIILYGLAAYRGKVIAGIEFPGYEEMEHPVEMDVPAFGIPYNLRVPEGEFPAEELKALCGAIRRAVCV